MTFATSKNNLQLFILLLTIGFPFGAIAATNVLAHQSKDTLQQKNEAKHFVKPSVYFTVNAMPSRDIHPKPDTIAINGRYYAYQQRNLGFNAPLSTKIWFNNDSTKIESLQLLTTVNLSNERVSSSILNESRKFKRLSASLKMIYSDGGKNTYFFAVSPFSSFDEYGTLKSGRRLAAVFIYNRTVSPKFSYRLGFMKSYLFGRNLSLPIIGFRFGRLDAVNFNIQLFRTMSLNIPLSKKFYFNVYTKPVASIYSFENNYNTGFLNKGTVVQLRRWELQTGLSFTYRPNPNLSLFAAVGSSRGTISFAENNKKISFKNNSYQNYKLDRGGFINLGISISLGKSKLVTGNYTQYDALDLNIMYGNDDNNIQLQNNLIPKQTKAQEIKNLQFNDVKDLINETDIY